MSFLYFEGTKDFIAATPVLMTTFEASGSITAGRLVAFNSATDQRVYQGVFRASTVACAGLAVQTVANGDPCPVIVWGYVKNMSVDGALTYNAPFTISSSYAFSSGSAPYANAACYCGKAISGSATLAIGFIDCMKNAGST
jgi:hypothetical protein